jgi:DNA gyrase/topoisomerase IV subunit A
MITHEKIDEWIKEVEERPSSAQNIIRYIARRLSDLTNRNEELLNENIALRLGKKIEEYESRIANLEYQLEILQRQIGSGEVISASMDTTASAGLTASLLVYNGFGQILRVEVNSPGTDEPQLLAKFAGEVSVDGLIPRLLGTSTQEELLFVFDSGRAVAMPVTAIPAASQGELNWEKAFLQEPRGSEELVTILAMAKMTLADLCIQTSRRGFVKKMSEAFFESCVTSSFVGTGTKQKKDKTCSLIFTGKSDLFVLVSKEGRSFSMEANKLPITIEPVFLISATDHIVNTFMVRKKPYLMFVTNHGKAVYRDIQWLEQANTFRTQGQLLFSKNRRETGTWIVGAAAVDEKDWGVALTADGKLERHVVSDLFETGSLGSSEIVDFVIYGTERWY